MIQLALRSSTQAESPFGVDEIGQDRRQRDGRDHQLEAGEEHACAEHGEQRRARSGGSMARECNRGGRDTGPGDRDTVRAVGPRP